MSRRITKAIRCLLRMVVIAREVLGDRAYERYREHAISRGQSAMPPEEFYISQIERTYTRPNRCC